MSREIDGGELHKLQPIIEAARQTATQATCQKDQRGVIIFKGDEILATAYNGPLHPFECEQDKCFNVCGLFAIHAERRAIINALENKVNLDGASVLHVRIDNDHEIQVSGKLKCEDCSGYMLRVLKKGISLKEFILLQENGWTAYEIPELDEQTRKNRGLS